MGVGNGGGTWYVALHMYAINWQLDSGVQSFVEVEAFLKAYGA